MLEKKKKEDLLAETLSRQPGSPESRAAARMLTGPEGPPIIVTEYVSPGPRDEQGRMIGPPTCNSKTAEVNGKVLIRGGTETDANFRRRCIAAVPARKWSFITLRGDA
jgi:hypothetical protein